MPRESNIQPKLIDAQDVARLYGISERSVWRMSKRGQIPPPVRFDHRATRWRLADLLEHIKELNLDVPQGVAGVNRDGNQQAS